MVSKAGTPRATGMSPGGGLGRRGCAAQQHEVLMVLKVWHRGTAPRLGLMAAIMGLRNAVGSLG